VVVGVCLAMLAGAGVVAARAVRWHGSVTLLAGWTGTEQERFQRGVIDKFEKKYRIHVLYQGSSAESQVLAADVASGTSPDVAVLPGPGELARYASEGRLMPLDGLVDLKGFGTAWVSQVDGGDGSPHTYWVPVKADLKSMVWHPAALTAAERTSAATDPAAWCLGMGSGATSGWPGTDWVEDILLQQSGPEVYQSWALGTLSWSTPSVRQAWLTWAGMVGAGRPEYARRALTTDYGDASKGVAARESGCRLEHQAAFVRGAPGWLTAGARYVRSATLIPGAKPDSRAWEVSGDLAALLSDRPQAKKLIRYLASEEAQRAWITGKPQTSGFSADRGVLAAAYSADPLNEHIAATLRAPTRTAVHCYDASDVMPGPMRDAFELAVLRFLADPEDLNRQLGVLDTVRKDHRAAGLTSVCDAT
jgi:alpha-glucoside transport system substrate-binding protein